MNFILRTDFLNFLHENGEVALRVAQQLSETYHAAIAEMRSIGLSHSAGEKLARFLLDWCADHGEGNAEIHATLTLTHEEIGQMIGASRETVTRLFADFKKKQLLQMKGATLIVRNKAGLQSLAGNWVFSVAAEIYDAIYSRTAYRASPNGCSLRATSSRPAPVRKLEVPFLDAKNSQRSKA